MAKPVLGFPTQKALDDAVRKLVNAHSCNEEFFYPLLERLFIERHRIKNELGPKYDMFRKVRSILTNGMSVDWFEARHNGMWFRRSWRDAIKGKTFNIEDELKAYAHRLAQPFKTQYLRQHGSCEWRGCLHIAKEVHHVHPMKQIIKDALAILTPEDLDIAEKCYDYDNPEEYSLQDNHPFVVFIKFHHQKSDILRSLCHEHHVLCERRARG